MTTNPTPADDWRFDAKRYERDTEDSECTTETMGKDGSVRTVRPADLLLADAPRILAECVRRGEQIDTLTAELHRVRTTEHAAAHALDVLRQSAGLSLIQGEHPVDTGKRIAAVDRRES